MGYHPHTRRKGVAGKEHLGALRVVTDRSYTASPALQPHTQRAYRPPVAQRVRLDYIGFVCQGAIRKQRTRPVERYPTPRYVGRTELSPSGTKRRGCYLKTGRFVSLSRRKIECSCVVIAYLLFALLGVREEERSGR